MILNPFTFYDCESGYIYQGFIDATNRMASLVKVVTHADNELEGIEIKLKDPTIDLSKELEGDVAVAVDIVSHLNGDTENIVESVGTLAIINSPCTSTGSDIFTEHCNIIV